MNNRYVANLIAQLQEWDRVFVPRYHERAIDRAVIELIETGAPAVPALIEVLEGDQRICDWAVFVLGEIGAPAVPALVEELKCENSRIRGRAAMTLRYIGAPAVSALIELLKCKNSDIRVTAVAALGSICGGSGVSEAEVNLKLTSAFHTHMRERADSGDDSMGDASAVPALFDVLTTDTDRQVRDSACLAFSMIGTPAVPVLIEALKKRRGRDRDWVAKALEWIGDAETLPREILIDARFSPAERIDLLDRLRGVRGITSLYTFPDTRVLCQAILNEEDIKARKTAQSVLNWLDGERELLHASPPDTSKQEQELVRVAKGGDNETHPKTLLRASDESRRGCEITVQRLPLRQRLFGNKFWRRLKLLIFPSLRDLP